MVLFQAAKLTGSVMCA